MLKWGIENLSWIFVPQIAGEEGVVRLVVKFPLLMSILFSSHNVQTPNSESYRLSGQGTENFFTSG
jgi:hypothetical protein